MPEAKLTELQRLVFDRLMVLSTPGDPAWRTADEIHPGGFDRAHPGTQAYGQALSALAKKGLVEVDYGLGYIGRYRVRWDSPLTGR